MASQAPPRRGGEQQIWFDRSAITVARVTSALTQTLVLGESRLLQSAPWLLVALQSCAAPKLTVGVLIRLRPNLMREIASE